MIRKKWKHFLISAALLTIIFVSIERYNNYIGQKFYKESTQGLFATYEQLDKTFLMFVQRNWNALEDWCNYLNYCVEEQDKKERNAEDGCKDRSCNALHRRRHGLRHHRKEGLILN